MLSGFKTFNLRDIPVAATERVNLPPVVLEVGDLEETITVRKEAALVQTTTGARSASITRDNIEDIPLKGWTSSACSACSRGSSTPPRGKRQAGPC